MQSTAPIPRWSLSVSMVKDLGSNGLRRPHCRTELNSLGSWHQRGGDRVNVGHGVIEEYEHISLGFDPPAGRQLLNGARRTFPRDPRQLSLGQSPNFLPVGRLSELGLSVACLQRTQISHGRAAA